MNNQVGNAQLMQKMNRLKVLNFVRNNPDCSRPQIAEATGLSLPSLTNITTYLLEVGILCENGVESVSRVGRKSVLLRLKADKYDLICVLLKESGVVIARTDMEGTVKETQQLWIEGMSSTVITNRVCDAIVSMVNACEKDRVLGIGVAISGLVLSDSRFIMSSKLKWNSFDIKTRLEDQTGIPVFIDNVSVLKAAWYFSRNFKNSNQNMLFVDLENGIGAVVYQGGSIQRNIIGEIGHATVEKDGPKCFCGNDGCLEVMCSPQRLLNLYKEEAKNNTSGEENAGKEVKTLAELEERFLAGDVVAKGAIADCGKYLGIGLANLINLFNPATLVIDTGDFSDCPSIIEEAREELCKRAYVALTQKLPMMKVKETQENVICGTAFDLCDKVFDISSPANIIE